MPRLLLLLLVWRCSGFWFALNESELRFFFFFFLRYNCRLLSLSISFMMLFFVYCFYSLISEDIFCFSFALPFPSRHCCYYFFFMFPLLHSLEILFFGTSRTPTGNIGFSTSLTYDLRFFVVLMTSFVSSWPCTCLSSSYFSFFICAFVSYVRVYCPIP